MFFAQKHSELSPSELKVLSKHLEVCPECAGFLAELKRINNLAAQAEISGVPSQESLDNIKEFASLMLTPEQTSIRKFPSFMRSFAHLSVTIKRVALTAAALLLVLLGIRFFIPGTVTHPESNAIDSFPNTMSELIEQDVFGFNRELSGTTTGDDLFGITPESEMTLDATALELEIMKLDGLTI